MTVPEGRIRTLVDEAVGDGAYVLYWMTAFRRTRSSFSLDRALELCRDTGRPLVVLEALRVGYRWASDRIHRFVIDGMADNSAAFGKAKVAYLPYVEPEEGAGKGLLEALGKDACAVVTDDFPCFFLPRMLAAAAERLDVRLEAIDSNGLYPLRDTDKVFARAYDFRRHLQKTLRPHLSVRPHPDPLADDGPHRGGSIPAAILERWPASSKELLGRKGDALAELPIDHDVTAVDERGGQRAAYERLQIFLEEGLPEYGEGRNHPDRDASSRLSPYLHFGHISAHQVFEAVVRKEGWSPDELSDSARGKREGWWGMSEGAESFLDELVTWREVGFNMTSHRDDYDQLDSLPDWAKKTMLEHAEDEREYVYSLEELETADTHDEVWNAAQRELVATGRMHNYLRMLWGKKIYQWSATPQDALDAMIELNNKYALDGRNPNSYSGIFWVLGRYDRAWGPEREVFGKLRYMTSDSTKRKLQMKGYLQRWGSEQQADLFG